LTNPNIRYIKKQFKKKGFKMSDVDGFDALTEFVKSNLDSKTNAEKASKQIKMALTFGIIPKDAFKEALSVPFEELFEKIKTIAEQKRYLNINTEEGVEFCKKLY
jgi:hypothetical protein